MGSSWLLTGKIPGKGGNDSLCTEFKVHVAQEYPFQQGGDIKIYCLLWFVVNLKL